MRCGIDGRWVLYSSIAMAFGSSGCASMNAMIISGGIGHDHSQCLLRHWHHTWALYI